MFRSIIKSISLPSLPVEEVIFAQNLSKPSTHPQDVAEAMKYRFDKDKRRFLSGRNLLRNILATYSNIPANALVFWRDHFGKLSVQDSNLHFSLSYTTDAFAIAIARQPVGIDIEVISNSIDIVGVAKVVLHPEEEQWLFTKHEKSNAIRNNDAHTDFFYLWTRKEAYLKKLGTGFQTEATQTNLLSLANIITVSPQMGLLLSVAY
ncbi:MAG: 4'-phosphopantetheinyl transferase superfamily protein [Saprospiraceae bacterium]|nr:4'-phosphopantetheinyl transferase superfamily protein [Saprospiraceae bacterium]MBP7679565.1 4'-phosphopantetheinyl transferase superfamily protein [Saprospiraceae bacterium]